mmetsp:Transcript_123607/g.224786  ORF Transcript_123607/g.224786 Transcript_123607/m.224786 type:complete len:97 (-) Transcript_123607:28-318(-)
MILLFLQQMSPRTGRRTGTTTMMGSPKKGHGGDLHNAPKDKKAIRKKAQWKEAATAVQEEYADNRKSRDRRRHGARDNKSADIGRLILSSSLGCAS